MPSAYRDRCRNKGLQEAQGTVNECEGALGISAQLLRLGPCKTSAGRTE